MSTGCKSNLFAWTILAMVSFPFLTGCPTRPSPPAEATVPRRLPGQNPPLPAHEGRPYELVTQESLLTIRVFRGGPLAKAGHNHVIASHALHGTLYVPWSPTGQPADLTRTTLEASFPVAELTVDESSLRAKENEADFPPEVPDSAKEGTRKNMLGPALLDSEHAPEIRLRSLSLQALPGAGAEWQARMEVTVRDRPSTVVVPVHYEQHAEKILLTGELPLKQTDLGLTPFSALLGALQVVDEMQIRFRIYFTPSSTSTASAL